MNIHKREKNYEKFALENIAIVAGINKLKSSFCAILSVLVNIKTSLYLRVGG